jgi:hypothetical protein
MPRTDFTVTLRPQPNVDAIKALRRLLKFAGRQLGLRAIRIEERQGSDVEPPLALTIRLDVWDAADTASSCRRACENRPIFRLCRPRDALPQARVLPGAPFVYDGPYCPLEGRWWVCTGG